MTGQQEYRITGEQITKLLYFEEMFPSISNIIREILSCPVHEQQYPIPNDEQCRICEQAIRKDATEKVLDTLNIELDEVKSRIESSAMGQPLSERSRGEIIGLLHAREKIKYLRKGEQE